MQDANQFITDDATSFVDRELRREKRYEGILDPPKYGRGPKGNSGASKITSRHYYRNVSNFYPRMRFSWCSQSMLSVLHRWPRTMP